MHPYFSDVVKGGTYHIADGTHSLNSTSSLMAGENTGTQKGKGKQKQISRQEEEFAGSVEEEKGTSDTNLQSVKFDPFSSDTDATISSSMNNTNHSSAYSSYDNSCNNSIKAQQPSGRGQGNGQGQGKGNDNGLSEKYPPLITKPGLTPQSLPLVPSQGQVQGQFLRKSTRKLSGGNTSQTQVCTRYSSIKILFLLLLGLDWIGLDWIKSLGNLIYCTIYPLL